MNKLTEYINNPINCGGVYVRPGDVVMADFNGVLIIPIEFVDEVADAAHEHIELEKTVRYMLSQGEPLRGTYPPNKNDAKFQKYDAIRRRQLV